MVCKANSMIYENSIAGAFSKNEREIVKEPDFQELGLQCNMRTRGPHYMFKAVFENSIEIYFLKINFFIFLN